jgi:hypothetical protein
MSALIFIGFAALVIAAIGVTGSALTIALMGKAFGGTVGPGAYVMAVVAALLWVAVYFLAPFEFVLKGPAA